MILREEAEHLKSATSEEEDPVITTQDSIHCNSQDVVIATVKINFIIFSANVKDIINNFFLFLEYSSVYTWPVYMMMFLEKDLTVTKENWLETGHINRAMQILKLRHP